MALQHLRSSTANKRPLPAGMSDGQLAVNTNSASPGLFFKDSAGNLVKAGPVHVGTTAPNVSPASGGATGNSTGELWLDTSVSPNQLKTWNGSAWVSDFPDEIPVAKLADGAARQLLQTDAAGTGVEWTSNVDVPGTLDVTSTATFDSIASHSLGSAGAPTITFTGDTNTGLYSPGADQVAISTGGTGRLFVDANGNVGVKASAPFQYGVPVADLAHLQLTSQQYSIVTLGGTDGATGQKYWRLISRASEAKFQLQSVDDNGNNEATAIEVVKGTAQAIDNVQLHTNGSERLRITSAGLVGVGTSAPNYQLHVTSSFAVGAAGFNQQLTFSNDTIQSLLLGTGYTALKLNPLGGNVGVGTSSPAQFLHLKSAGDTKLLLNSTNNASDRGIYFATSTDSEVLGYIKQEYSTGKFEISSGSGTYGSSISFRTGGTADRVLIDSSGRLGVGTTTPSSYSTYGNKLVVYGTGTDGPGITIATGTSDTGSLYFADGTTGNEVARGAVQYAHASDALLFQTAATERARIDSSGRLLVGTSSARSNFFNVSSGTASTLQIEGTSYQTSSIAIINNEAATSSNAFILAKSRGTTVGSNTIVNNGDTIGTISFQGNDGSEFVEAARIDTLVDGTPGTNDMPGRLVFSTTADGASSPTSRLVIKETGDIVIPATSATKGLWIGTGDAAGNSASANYRIGQNSTGIASGTLYIGNSAIQVSSDIRLKENIENTNLDALDALNRVSVKDFTWNDPSDTSLNNRNARGKWTGLIAQEIVEILPFVVNAPRDQNGEIDHDSESIWTLDQSQLCPVLIKAIQQQQSLIASLEARLSALEAQ